MSDEKKRCKHDFRTHDMRGNKEEYIHDFGKKRGLEIWKWDGHKLVCCKCGELLTLKLFKQKIRTQQKADDMKIMKKLIKQIPFPNKEEQKKMNIKIEKAFEVKKHETKKTM